MVLDFEGIHLGYLQKKSFKVDFNHFISGRDFHGVEKLNLNGEHNDVSIMRAKLSWDLYQSMGMVSSRAAHAKLYINGDYYGLYISVEHIDDSFYQRTFKMIMGIFGSAYGQPI